MTSLFPEILHTPRLTLTQFSPDFDSDAEYATVILPHVTTVSEFDDFCVDRAPIPWASHAIVYLLRLRRSDSDDDAHSEPVQLRRTSEEADGIYDKVIGHVSVAHSLRERQPRIRSPETSSSDDGPSVTDTENFASVPLRTSTIPDIGWRIQPIHQRFGYASEAAERLVQFLCADEEGPRFRTLCCFAGETNAGSRGVARKVGFVDVVVDFGSGMADEEESKQHEESSRGDDGGQDGEAGEVVDDPYGHDIHEDVEGSIVVKDELPLSKISMMKSDITSTHKDAGKVLTCPSVAKGIWFGILGDGWTWREGRPRHTALEKSVAALFETMAFGTGVKVQQRKHGQVHDEESASE